MSHLHPPDARLPLLAAVVASVAIALMSSPASLFVVASLAAFALVIAIALGALDGRSVLRRLLRVNIFLLLVWATVPWVWQSHGFVLDDNRVQLATIITLRVNAIVAVCLLWLAPVGAVQWARAAGALGLPRRLAQLLGLTVRFIEEFAQARVRLERAARLRTPAGRDMRGAVRLGARLVAALLVQALVKAERRERALRARGFFAALTRPGLSWRGLPARQWVGAALTMTGVVLAWVVPEWWI